MNEEQKTTEIAHSLEEIAGETELLSVLMHYLTAEIDTLNSQQQKNGLKYGYSEKGSRMFMLSNFILDKLQTTSDNLYEIYDTINQ